MDSKHRLRRNGRKYPGDMGLMVSLLIIFIVLPWQFFSVGPVAGSGVGSTPELSSVGAGNYLRNYCEVTELNSFVF